MILEAARVCDLAELARIANEDPDNPFRYSMPDRGDPLQYWTGSKFDPTILSVLFSLPATLHTFKDTQNGQVIEEFYVWPSAAGPSPSDADWTAAEAL